MNIAIRPSRPFGRVAAPPSKSMAHRLLICAGLASGESEIEGVAPSEDVLATIDCLRALGAQCELKGARAHVRGADPRRREKEVLLPCRECGSTLRFFIPLCLLAEEPAMLTGSRVLLARPLSVYENLCAERGLLFARGKDALRVGGPLRPGRLRIPGGISSQFVSGLLFALPLLEEGSEIALLPPVESRSYIDMTLSALAQFGVRASWKDEYTIAVPGGQSYRPGRLRVEGDHSNAAFLAALGLKSGAVEVTGLCGQSLQGDRVFGEYFARLQQGWAQLNIADCPDLGPVLMAVAALFHGGTLTGTARLALKESDRGRAMQQELAKCGARVRIEKNTITVEPGLHAPAEPFDGHNDHRIVMALCVLAAHTGGVIRAAQAVNKSFPDFFKKLRVLHVEVEEIGMDQ